MSNRKDFDLSVYVLIDPSVCGGERVEEVTRAVLDGGATFLQLRNKLDPDDVLEDQALRIKKILDSDDAYSHVRFVIDDRAELAARVDVDGVHVGQDDMDYRQARAIIGEDKILGHTAFTLDHYAATDPKIVDYVGTGVVFPTATKPDKAVMGVDGFAELVKHAPVPVVGIGGIELNNAGDVIKAGANGVAMIGSVVGADDPKAVTEAFVKIVKEARSA